MISNNRFCYYDNQTFWWAETKNQQMSADAVVAALGPGSSWQFLQLQCCFYVAADQKQAFLRR